MTISTTVPALPTAPDPATMTPTAFAAAAAAYVLAQKTEFQPAVNALAAEMNALAAALTSIAAGTALTLLYTVSSTITDADPTPGLMRFSNFADQSAATTLRFDLVDASGSDKSGQLTIFGASTSAIKGYVRITKLTDATKWLLYSVSALASPSGYKNVTAAYVDGSGTAPFINGDGVVVEFTRNGDIGSTGPSGTQPLIYTARTSDTALTAANFVTGTRVHIEATGTWTQTIVAGAGIATNDWCSFKNAGNGIITINPNASETIDGALTVKVYPGESCRILWNGSAFFTTGLAQKGAAVELSRQTASASATLDFANVFSSDFDEYEISIIKLKPATDNTVLNLLTSSDGGSTYDVAAASYDYVSAMTSSGFTVSGTGSTSATALQLTGKGVGNSTGEWTNLKVNVFKPSDAEQCSFSWNGMLRDSGGNPYSLYGMGNRLASADVDSFRLLFASGNIASGTVIVRGIKK